MTPKKVSQGIVRKKDTVVGVLMGMRGKMTPKRVSQGLLRKKDTGKKMPRCTILGLVGHSPVSCCFLLEG